MPVRPLAGSFGVDPVVEGAIGAYFNSLDNYVCHRICPPIDTRGALRGVVNLVSVDSFFGDADRTLERAPGDAARRLLGPGISNVTYTSREYAAESGADDQEIPNARERGLPVDLQELHGLMVAESVRLKCEALSAAHFLSATNYAQTSTPATKWDAAAATPLADSTGNIELAIRTVENAGRAPNTIVFSKTVARVLMTNAGTNSILGRLSLLKDRTRLSRQDLIDFFLERYGLELFIAYAVANTASMGQTAAISDVWGDGVWVGYIDRGIGAGAVTDTGLSVRSSAAILCQAQPFSLEQYRDEVHLTTLMRARINLGFAAAAPNLGYYISDVIT